jgi:hypothetical protein
MRYSGVLAALNARIDSHRADGKLLEGFQFRSTPTSEQEGARDLPMIRLQPATFAEVPHANKIVDGPIVFRFTVAVAKTETPVGLLQAVEQFEDAIETDPETGEIDVYLGGVVVKPVQIALTTCDATDLSLTAQLTISAQPRPVNRGRRS